MVNARTSVFLVYINDLAANFVSEIRLFADNISLFHVVTDADVSTNVLNHDFKTIENWACQWKMSFNPDPTKSCLQAIFSSKSVKAVNSPIYFNNSAVVTVPHHKHIGLVLDGRILNFCRTYNISKKLLLRPEEAYALLNLWQDMFPEMFLIN